MPKEDFRREVEEERASGKTEAWQIIYFKLYKSQIPVVEQTIETAALVRKPARPDAGTSTSPTDIQTSLNA
jgi:hypothetical protein